MSWRSTKVQFTAQETGAVRRQGVTAARHDTVERPDLSCPAGDAAHPAMRSALRCRRHRCRRSAANIHDAGAV